MASSSGGKYCELLWEKAFESVKIQFEIENLLPEQEESVKTFFEKGNLFVNLPTGYGKSLIYQCLPIVSDVLKSKPRGSSLVVVISPLTSLMKDQVGRLQELGVPAIALTDKDDEELVQQIINGNFIVIYCSPESVLSTVGRAIFSDPVFNRMVIAIAIDEAHCITQWGFSGSKNAPAFRKWYSCLGELQSLTPADCQIVILTATATKETKQQILDSLHLKLRDVTVIEQSPNKENLMYCKLYMDKNEKLEALFGSLINEIKDKKAGTERTLIYCQTRKQCSILFRLFEIHLGKAMYFSSAEPRNRMVEMYHAGTPSQVKEHISNNMAKANGQIRILISTVAFGMGVDSKEIHRIVHFGPPKTLESYVQECGRAGRDGLPSICVLLYNGLTSVHCDYVMKTFLQNEKCLRKQLMSHFGFELTANSISHQCCTNCHKNCECGECGDIWTPHAEESENVSFKERTRTTRQVSDADRRTFKKELVGLHRQKLQQVQIEHMITCPNILLEFNMFHINQLVENMEYLFTIKDVMESAEIWRTQYATDVIETLERLYGDTGFSGEDGMEVDEEYSMLSGWSQIRDDPTLFEMYDSRDLEDISSLMCSQNESTSSAGD